MVFLKPWENPRLTFVNYRMNTGKPPPPKYDPAKGTGFRPDGTAVGRGGTYFNGIGVAGTGADIEAWKKKWNAAGAALNAAGPALTELYNQRVAAAGGGGGGDSAPAPAPVVLNYDDKKFSYNIGCVRDAYFSKRQSFHQALTPNAKGSIKDSPVTIASSEELWSRAGTNKGMITLFMPKDTGMGLDAVTPVEGSPYSPKEWEKYGFQFHYNPTSIDMVYSGAPNTDAALEMSGQEKFNLIGAQVSQSTLALDIVLNRVADMKYYDEKGRIKASVPDRNNLYAPRFPSPTEQLEIYKKGTMYDVEFLLSTVIGYKIETKYRGRTADVGWLSGRPVTLNLGKGLKYLGYINAFSVKHVIFNEKMVPVFSTLSLNFNRIPDYAGI